MDKKETRKLIRSEKLRMSEEEIAASSRRIMQQLFSLPEYIVADIVLSYMAVNQEVRTKEIIEKALADGKAVGIPRTFGSRKMDFFTYDPKDLITGFGGIPEPGSGCKPADPEEPGKKCIILIPGIAFSRSMDRIGYGGGYYDTYLEKHPGITKIALCHSFQLFDEIPSELHDVKMDMILTDTGKILK